ncbi:KRFJ protein, partial [Scytalopus superciliaris]|nr:KRFJ protein [Scytalopus superciliaris]
ISSRCLPGCEMTCPQPCAFTRSLGPCVTSCGDSRAAVVYAPPVLLTFPGPTFSSSPQESIVGSSFPQPSGALTSSSSGMGGSYGSGGSFGSGGMSGMGGSSGFGGSIGYG